LAEAASHWEAYHELMKKAIERMLLYSDVRFEPIPNESRAIGKGEEAVDEPGF